MKNAAGFSVRIFLPTGEPEGLRIVEKSNWTGQGLVFPRARFAEAKKRDELKRTGVYILWGPSESGHLPRVYAGEGDVVLSRLDQHAKQKEARRQGPGGDRAAQVNTAPRSSPPPSPARSTCASRLTGRK